MPETPQPASDPVRPKPQAASAAVPLPAVCLAVGWLLVPAAQYYASYRRTAALVGVGQPDPSLAALDLTPLYAVLLCGTLAYALLRYFDRRGEADSGSRGAPAGTEAAS